MGCEWVGWLCVCVYGVSLAVRRGGSGGERTGWAEEDGWKGLELVKRRK
jgi:hypothetical protein